MDSTQELLHQKDDQIEALCNELRDAQRRLLDAKRGSTTILPSQQPPVDDTLRRALEAQIASNQTLAATNKSLQKRLKALELESKTQRHTAETEHGINEGLTQVVQRAGQAMLHRDSEVRGIKNKLLEREDEIRRLRGDRLDARRAVLDELTLSKEKEFDVARLRYDNTRLLELVQVLQKKVHAYEVDHMENNAAIEVRAVPAPVFSDVTESVALKSLRKQNVLLQEQYTSSLVLLQRQLHAETVKVVAAAEKPRV